MTTSAACRRTEHEGEYRRGFSDGWIEAVEAMYALLTEGPTLGRTAAYTRWFDHWEIELIEWQRQDCQQLVLPPAVPLCGDSRKAAA